MAQLEVSKPEPTKSLFVFEGLKLFDHNVLVFSKSLSFVIFQNLSVFSISSLISISPGKSSYLLINLAKLIKSKSSGISLDIRESIIFYQLHAEDEFVHCS